MNSTVCYDNYYAVDWGLPRWRGLVYRMEYDMRGNNDQETSLEGDNDMYSKWMMIVSCDSILTRKTKCHLGQGR